jgi:hypothetical protein
MGIFWCGKKVIFSSPIVTYYVAHVIHECAHIFATNAEPHDSSEIDFLGWEMIVAEQIGLPWPAWRAGNRGYCIEGMGPDLPGFIEDCSAEQFQLLYEDRVSYAKHIGIVDSKNRPLAVR